MNSGTMKTGIAVVVIAGAVVVDVACTKQQAQNAAHVGEQACTLVAAFAGTPDEEAICADAGELLGLAFQVRADRADAGAVVARRAEKCQIVGDVCATDGEIARAIKARRAARSLVEAGAR